MAGSKIKEKAAGATETETKLLDPPKNVSTTPGACLEIIRRMGDPALRRNAAIHLLALIEGGAEVDDAEIKEMRRAEKDLAVRNALSRVANKLGFRKLLNEDPAAYYDRKLSSQEEFTLYEEIKRLKIVYDKAKKKPGAFDEKYTVLDVEIGKGGMARILKGVRRSDGMAVAFKYLMLDRLSRYASKDTLTALFLNEGRLLSERLDHPCVVKAFDYGVAEGEYFIVLEYIEGSSLLHTLERGALDLSQFRVTGMKILDGLEYIHSKGVIHRDMNPKNILVGNGASSDVLKLIDFGLALDRKGGYMAPPGFRGYNGAYTSPQQKEEFNDVDQRDDIYSAGVVFYEMLGGRIGGREIDAGALAVLPESVRGAVARCVERERDKRWKNAGELKRALFGAS